MIIDAHAHIFPNVCGMVGAGRVEGRSYGRVTIGDQTIQGLPPYCERAEFTAEMLVAHMNWADVDRAVLLQARITGSTTSTL